MKKVVLTLSIFTVAIAANAQNAKDSTACDKLQAKIDKARSIYADSMERMRADFVIKGQDARRQFIKDSIAGKTQKGSIAPIAMTPAARTAIVELKKREVLLIRPWQLEMKKEKCKIAGKMPEKMPQTTK